MLQLFQVWKSSASKVDTNAVICAHSPDDALLISDDIIGPEDWTWRQAVLIGSADADVTRGVLCVCLEQM